MKKIFIIAMILLIPFCSVAQRKNFKLMESVPKEKPKWMSEKERGDSYIYIKGVEENTLSDAKNAAIQMVAEEIAQSVAVVVSGEVINTSGFKYNGNKDEFEAEMIRKTKLKLAKLPALQGLTIAKADVYYERYYCRKTGEEYYRIFVKYPFNDFERHDLLNAYNQKEKDLTDKVAAYEAEYETTDDVENIDKNIIKVKALLKEFDEEDSRYIQCKALIKMYRNKKLAIYNDEYETVSSIEDIDKNIIKINAFMKELGEDDPIYTNCKALIEMYKKMCKAIIVEVVENSPGHMAVRLVYDGRMITTSQKPKIKTDCASNLNIQYKDGICHLTFTTEYCYEQDEPTNKFTFKACDATITKELRIKFR